MWHTFILRHCEKVVLLVAELVEQKRQVLSPLPQWSLTMERMFSLDLVSGCNHFHLIMSQCIIEHTLTLRHLNNILLLLIANSFYQVTDNANHCRCSCSIPTAHSVEGS